MQIQEHVGHAGLAGWRKTVADVVARPAANHGPVSEEQARALVGGAFFVLSVYYVVATIVRAVRASRA